jgi:N-acetylglucosamine-6-phosphate deacetylase
MAALRERGVVVAAGHTAATAAELRAALDAGVTGVTHLFNAMPPLGHREPGPVGVSLTDARVTAGLIVDGVHVDPSVVAIAFALLGPSRTMLVSDAVAAASMPAGTYDLGGIELITDGVSVRLRDGTLAGSVLTLDAAVRNLVSFTGSDATQAITAATTTPAAFVGASHVGRIEVGAQADLVVLDAALDVRATIVRGVLAHDAR